MNHIRALPRACLAGTGWPRSAAPVTILPVSMDQAIQPISTLTGSQKLHRIQPSAVKPETRRRPARLGPHCGWVGLRPGLTRCSTYGRPAPLFRGSAVIPDTWAEKIETLQRICSLRETNGSFDSYNSCKRLVPSRLHVLHESKFQFVSRIEFFCSKLSIFSAHVSGITIRRKRALRRAWRWPSVRRAGPHVTCEAAVLILSPTVTPDTWAEKFESFERINSIRETNVNFDSCNSCKQLGTSRLHELHESKFPFVSRIEFIRSKLSNFSAHVYGVSVAARGLERRGCSGSRRGDSAEGVGTAIVCHQNVKFTAPILNIHGFLKLHILEIRQRKTIHFNNT